MGIREILQQRELDSCELVIKEELMSVNKLIEDGAFENEFSSSDLVYTRFCIVLISDALKRQYLDISIN